MNILSLLKLLFSLPQAKVLRDLDSDFIIAHLKVVWVCVFSCLQFRYNPVFKVENIHFKEKCHPIYWNELITLMVIIIEKWVLARFHRWFLQLLLVLQYKPGPLTLFIRALVFLLSTNFLKVRFLLSIWYEALQFIFIIPIQFVLFLVTLNSPFLFFNSRLHQLIWSFLTLNL